MPENEKDQLRLAIEKLVRTAKVGQELREELQEQEKQQQIRRAEKIRIEDERRIR